MAPTATTERELSLANTMRQFDTGNRDGRVLERLEARHRGAASLDRPMILLDEVVQILVRPYHHVAPAWMFASQQPQRATTGNLTIERHFARHAWQGGRERLAKERLRSRDSSIASKQEVDGLAMLVDSSVQVVPLRLDLDLRLIDAPRGADRLGEPMPALLEFRHIPRNPTKDRRMRDVHAPLGHHLHQVPIWRSAVPWDLHR